MYKMGMYIDGQAVTYNQLAWKLIRVHGSEDDRCYYYNKCCIADILFILYKLDMISGSSI